MVDTPGAMPPVHVSPPKEICTWLKPNCPNDMGFLARRGKTLRSRPSGLSLQVDLRCCLSTGYSKSRADRGSSRAGTDGPPTGIGRVPMTGQEEQRTMQGTTIDIRRADSRPHTQIDWLDSRHSFSFGSHHDPANTGHGLLLVSNDDRVRGGAGFGTHAHRDMEIVTWVLSGRLSHRDSAGNVGELYPGLAQRMSAGTGIRHSEMNASPTDEVHFVQMWVPPDTPGIEPGYEQRDIND